LLRQAHDPLGEIARIDELHGIGRRAGREDVTAAAHAQRPVGEAVGGIARTDDEAGTHGRGRVPELRADDSLALRLQRPIQREAGGAHRLHVSANASGPSYSCSAGVFARRLRQIAVHRHRGDEDVALHLPRQDSRGDVPMTAASSGCRCTRPSVGPAAKRGRPRRDRRAVARRARCRPGEDGLRSVERLGQPYAFPRLEHPPGCANYKGVDMLHYAVVFLIIALIAAVFGFGGIAAGAMGIAKILFFVFIILAIVAFVAFVAGGRWRR
jgi:uncharacterized membrane protein YtjA (UPF0391 family)